LILIDLRSFVRRYQKILVIITPTNTREKERDLLLPVEDLAGRSRRGEHIKAIGSYECHGESELHRWRIHIRRARVVMVSSRALHRWRIGVSGGEGLGEGKNGGMLKSQKLMIVMSSTVRVSVKSSRGCRNQSVRSV
jgi:hypothetical protein